MIIFIRLMLNFFRHFLRLGNSSELDCARLNENVETYHCLESFQQSHQIASAYCPAAIRRCSHRPAGDELPRMPLRDDNRHAGDKSPRNHAIPGAVSSPRCGFTSGLDYFAGCWACDGSPTTMFLSMRSVTLLSTSISRLASLTSFTVP